MKRTFLLLGILLVTLISCEKEPLVYDYSDMLGVWHIDDETVDITLTIESVDPVIATFHEYNQPDPYQIEARKQDSILFLAYQREFYMDDPDLHWTLYVKMEARIITPTTMSLDVEPGADYHDGRGTQWSPSRNWTMIKQ